MEQLLLCDKASLAALQMQWCQKSQLIDLLAIVRGFVRERIPMPDLAALLRALAEDRVFRDAAEREPGNAQYSRERDELAAFLAKYPDTP